MAAAGASLLNQAAQMVRDVLTDATGQGFAIGRVLVVWMFLPMSLFPVGIAVYMVVSAPAGVAVPVSDWSTLLGACVGYYPALCAASTFLITGTAPTDPGGRIWGKGDGSPTAAAAAAAAPVTDPAPRLGD